MLSLCTAGYDLWSGNNGYHVQKSAGSAEGDALTSLTNEGPRKSQARCFEDIAD